MTTPETCKWEEHAETEWTHCNGVHLGLYGGVPSFKECPHCKRPIRYVEF